MTLIAAIEKKIDAEFDYGLWENINEQIDAENVSRFVRANIGMSLILYFIRCRIAWHYDRIYKAIDYVGSSKISIQTRYLFKTLGSMELPNEIRDQ